MLFFCHFLITFANSLIPDQAQQYAQANYEAISWPDLDPNCLKLKVKYESVFEKKVDDDKKNAKKLKLSSLQRLVR